MERSCNSCGSTDWILVYEESYPERRKDRHRTIKRIYVKQREDGSKIRNMVLRSLLVRFDETSVSQWSTIQ